MRWVTLGAPLLFGACATIAPPQPPSLELPQPPSDLRASRKGDRVTLTWTVPTFTTDRETVRSLGPTHVCRGPEKLKDCGAPVGETQTPVIRSAAASSKKPQGSYTDTFPAQLEGGSPSSFMTYAVQVLNREGRGAGLSNQVTVPLARTLPPPRDFQARVTGQGVVLSWSAEPAASSAADLQYVYRVFRHTEGSSDQALAGAVPASAETSYALTDAGIEWQKTYAYHAETVTILHPPDHSRLEVEGDDTPEVKVFADDVFPPSVPSDLQAVYSGPGQKPFIDLVWAPVSDVDLAGYNVYRREQGTAPVKLNTDLVRTPAYRDANVAPQRRYFYLASAVDVRGNESAQSAEASESVP